MYDYIIIGAGTAGCIIANRLTASGQHKVLLLESGGKDDNMFISMPFGFTQLFDNPKYTWLDRTVATKSYGGRSITMTQGRTFGGSSSINGMMYVRGHAEDYNSWARGGCPGWSWDEVLPYFKKSQHFANGDPKFHGHNGEMGVIENHNVEKITDAFIEAGQQAGLPYNADYNNGENYGISYPQVAIYKGRRQSTATAFLKPAMARKNLTVQTQAQVLRLTFNNGKATGVEIQNDNGQVEIITCNKEIILAAGAIGSPQILQHSGIGDPDHLKSLDIDIIAASPQVGLNLQDHLAAHLKYRVNSPADSINRMLNSIPRMVGELIRWRLSGKGIWAKSATEVMGFFKSSESLELPDVQMALKPLTFHVTPKGKIVIDKFPGVTISAFNVNSYSRGEVKIKDKDPAKRTEIDINYLSDQRDIEILTSGLLRMREIMKQPAIMAKGPVELEPGPNMTDPKELEAYIRNTADTIYHPVGTCVMGSDENSVLDPALRVRGVTGLRVLDASAMPKITIGNTVAATMMIAEKGSDLILADA